jgi:hypothetical protein
MSVRPNAIFSIALAASICAATSSADEFVFEAIDQSPVVHTEPIEQPAAVYSDTVESRISSLENEIEWLRKNQSTQNHNVLRNVECQMSCREVGCGGLFFAAEASFLRPYLSGANSSATATGGKWVDPTYGTAARLKLGYESDSGLGVRAQYFSLDHGIDLASRFGGGSLGLKLDVVDAEVTFRSRLRQWDLGVSGGVRYGYLGYTGDGVVIAPGQLTFEGIGATASIDGRRKLGNTGLSLFGNVRGSFLLGELHNGQPTAGLSYGSVEDEIMHVIENQLGVAWIAVSDGGVQLEVRAAWETQFWLNDTLADDNYGIGTNLALSGPSVAIELKY